MAENRDESSYVANTFWNDSSTPPGLRFAERQPTAIVDPKPAPLSDAARTAVAMERIAELLELAVRKLPNWN